MRITTLVPAYKPKYLYELLLSFRNQTVKPHKIIFSDDSPDQAFVALFNNESLKDFVSELNISVVPGPKQGAWLNFLSLLNNYCNDTDLFHVQLDDDICYPQFYERHLQLHSAEYFPCVISRRWTANEQGQPLKTLPVPAIIDQHTNRILKFDASVLFQYTAGRGMNWLGEFSNATFHINTLPDIIDASIGGVSYSGLEDIGSFIKVSMKSSVGFINEHLGFFRISPYHNSANPLGRPLKLAHLAYIALIISGVRLGYLSLELSNLTISGIAASIINHYSDEADMKFFCEFLPEYKLGLNKDNVFLRNFNNYLNS